MPQDLIPRGIGLIPYQRLWLRVAVRRMEHERQFLQYHPRRWSSKGALYQNGRVVEKKALAEEMSLLILLLHFPVAQSFCWNRLSPDVNLQRGFSESEVAGIVDLPPWAVAPSLKVRQDLWRSNVDL